MSLTTPRYRYDPVQRGFHWTMAAMIVIAIALGIVAAYLPPGTSPRRELLDFHKSIGMTVLVLLPLRLIYRLIRGEPAHRTEPDRRTHLAAKTAHWGLYGLMLAMPITGYIYSGAGGYSLPWFGVFTWPRLLSKSETLAHAGFLLHSRIAWVIGGLIVLHVLAVAWHVWIKRDDVLSRMAPDARATRS